MPDFNADKEHAQGIIKYAVRNAHPGMPIKTLKTGRGELKLDRLGRCLISDHALAAEVRKDYPLDLAVSRVFTNHPSDRDHNYVFGQMPALPYATYDELGHRIQPPVEAKEDEDDNESERWD